MFKFYKVLLILVIICFPFTAQSHVEHYQNVSRIAFDIYRNNKNIGTHIFLFKKSDNKIVVNSEINFEIKKFGVTLYKYHVKGSEVYEDGKLIKFNSKTKQNDKDKYVNIKLEDDSFVIDGSSYKGKAPTSYIIGTWWNHSIIKSKAQISAVSGRIIKQKVTFIGKETLKHKDKEIKTLHFNFSSTDEKLSKGKKLNTDVWYNEESLNWVKATFKKKGKWEYKLISIK